MPKIIICQSIQKSGSVIQTKTLAVLYEKEIPDDIDEIVEDFGGDFYYFIDESEEEEYD